MDINDKVIVVTGAGSGIGKAMVAAFAAQGAKAIVAADLDGEAAQGTAEQYNCTAVRTDVANESDIVQLIESTESTIGPIDLFCSNAGVLRGGGPEALDRDWQMSWEINVMAHVYVARHLVPKMIERGGGYLLNTASAAGLLNQIGAAPYGVSKHAAVGFAEWLALSYAHQGIKISVLCPQAVNTPMAQPADEHPGAQAAAVDGMMEADTVAEIVVDHLQREEFLILTHPEVKQYMQRKTADYGRWIGGMNRLLCKLTGQA